MNSSAPRDAGDEMRQPLAVEREPRATVDARPTAPREVTVDNAPGEREWDAFLERTPGGDLVQGAAWARLKQLSGIECHRVVVRVDGVIVAGVQLLARANRCSARFAGGVRGLVQTIYLRKERL